MTEAADRLWAFSLRVYGDPAVAATCLDLQDRHGIDVNLLLWAAWAGADGVRLDRATIAAAVDATRPWRDSVVRPLRAVRRAMKADLGTVSAAAGAGLRASIKAAELAAERLEQRALAALPLPRAGSDARAAVSDNLLLYLGFQGVVECPGLPHLVEASLAPIGGEGLGGSGERA
ncbi:MAG: TIGR02444 family protein [Alphaproteobacteria bacterium]